MNPNPPSTGPRDDGSVFATTRWTVVLEAGTHSSPQSDAALEELCRTYWYPLYAYVRRRGHPKADAEDLVQGFFARFLAKDYLQGLSSERGRFRAFLLASLKHYLANEWDKAARQKRGGGAQHLSLDWGGGETRFHAEPVTEDSPDRLYDREWATTLLARVLDRLGAECAAAGKAELFEGLKIYLTVGRDKIPYAVAARDTGLTEGTLRVAVHRLRRRYRELLRHEIAQTLQDADQVEEELRALVAVLQS